MVHDRDPEYHRSLHDLFDLNVFRRFDIEECDVGLAQDLTVRMKRSSQRDLDY